MMAVVEICLKHIEYVGPLISVITGFNCIWIFLFRHQRTGILQAFRPSTDSAISPSDLRLPSSAPPETRKDRKSAASANPIKCLIWGICWRNIGMTSSPTVTVVVVVFVVNVFVVACCFLLLLISLLTVTAWCFCCCCCWCCSCYCCCCFLLCDTLVRAWFDIISLYFLVAD